MMKNGCGASFKCKVYQKNATIFSQPWRKGFEVVSKNPAKSSKKSKSKK